MGSSDVLTKTYEFLGITMSLPELVRQVKAGSATEWESGVQVARQLAESHAEISDRGRRALTVLESAWTGGGAEAAQAKIKPAIEATHEAANTYEDNARTLADGASTFDQLKSALIPMPDAPPTRNFYDKITPWDTDTEDAINEFKHLEEQNRRIYESYEQSTRSMSQQIRIDYGQLDDEFDTDLAIAEDDSAGKGKGTGTITFHESGGAQGTTGPGFSGGVGSGGGGFSPPPSVPAASGSGGGTLTPTPSPSGGSSTSLSGFQPPTDTPPSYRPGGYQPPSFAPGQAGTPGGPGTPGGFGPVGGFGPAGGFGPTGGGFGPGGGAGAGGFRPGGFGPTGGAGGVGGAGGAGGAGGPGGAVAGPGRGTGVAPFGPGAQAGPQPVGQPGAGAAGRPGAMPMGAMGGGAGRGQGSEDQEHKRNYVQATDEVFSLVDEQGEKLRDPETGHLIAPPTIGG